MKRITTTALALFIACTLLAAPHSNAQSAKQVNATAAEQLVVFNTHSLKYHCASCSAAVRCTRNCITTTLADAKARGGIACKICGGTCRRAKQSHQHESVPVQHVRCCDGTLSPSCTYVHSGCCSHHGGVCQ